MMPLTGLAPLEQRVQRIEFRAMGSQILAAVDSDDPRAAALLAQVPAMFEEWEQALSRFRDSSELSNLNRSAGSPTPVAVSSTLWEVLELALQAASSTGGLVTPTVLDALIAAGYSQSFDTMSAATSGAKAATPTLEAWRGVKLYPATRAVRLPAGVRLDFGGVGKGWAADAAVAWLAEYGPALLDAGGDIAVSAAPRDEPGWPIGVDAPSTPDFAPDSQLALLSLAAGGVATSGRDFRRWQQDGRWRHHIIDPRTGEPSETDVLSATVIAPTASVAEIAAKTVFLLGSSAGMAWLEARPTLAGLLVREGGAILHSSRLQSYLWHDDAAN